MNIYKMIGFIYPRENCTCIYTYGRNIKTNNALRLLETHYPCLVDLSKVALSYTIGEIINELNLICGTENDDIIQFEFPIIFEGLEMIGNYDDLIHHLKSELQ